jgi:hypothetical protein
MRPRGQPSARDPIRGVIGSQALSRTGDRVAGPGDRLVFRLGRRAEWKEVIPGKRQGFGAGDRLRAGAGLCRQRGEVALGPDPLPLRTQFASAGSVLYVPSLHHDPALQTRPHPPTVRAVVGNVPALRSQQCWPAGRETPRPQAAIPATQPADSSPHLPQEPPKPSLIAERRGTSAEACSSRLSRPAPCSPAQQATSISSTAGPRACQASPTLEAVPG